MSRLANLSIASLFAVFLGLLVPYLLRGHIALGSALGAVVCAALLYAIYRRDRAANPRIEEVVSDRHFAEIRAIVARLEASTRSRGLANTRTKKTDS